VRASFDFLFFLITSTELGKKGGKDFAIREKKRKKSRWPSIIFYLQRRCGGRGKGRDADNDAPYLKEKKETSFPRLDKKARHSFYSSWQKKRGGRRN